MHGNCSANIVSIVPTTKNMMLVLVPSLAPCSSPLLNMSVVHAACSGFDLEGTYSAFEPVKTLVGDKCKLFEPSELQTCCAAGSVQQCTQTQVSARTVQCKHLPRCTARERKQLV